MELRVKIQTLFLILFFPRGSLAFIPMQADQVGYYYDAVCQCVSNDSVNFQNKCWEKRIYGDGLGIAPVLYELSKRQVMRRTGHGGNKFNTPIFIFGSYGVKGGSLFASVIKLIKDGFKLFNIAFIIDYFNPTGSTSKVCHKILNDIEIFAKQEGARVKIFRFHVPDKNYLISPNDLADIRHVEFRAETSGLMTSLDKTLYEVIDSKMLYEVIKHGTFLSGIMVDGIAGTKFEINNTNSVGLSTDYRIQTIQLAILGFAQVAKYGATNNATIVANILPSGMSKDSGEWLTFPEYQFPFHFVVCPGWPIDAINGKAFAGVKIYWTFFRLPSPEWIRDYNSISTQDDSTIFQVIQKTLSAVRRAERTLDERAVLRLLQFLIKLEKNDQFHAFLEAA